MDISKSYGELTGIEGVGLEAHLTEEARFDEPARPIGLLTPS
jgi:hypothetical protein